MERDGARGEAWDVQVYLAKEDERLAGQIGDLCEKINSFLAKEGSTGSLEEGE